MSTENSPQPIKTLDDWIRRVKELEEQINPAPWPWPFPDCEGPPDELPPLQGPLP